MRKLSFLCITAAFAFAALSVYGEGASARSTDPLALRSDLFSRLSAQLTAAGWSGTDISNFIESASNLDWSGAVTADPEVVALALEFAAQRNDINDPQLQAELALQIALAAVQMHEAGMTGQQVAVAAINAVQMVKSEMNPRGTSESGPPGQLVRTNVQSAINNAARLGTQRGLHSNGPPEHPPGQPPFDQSPGRGNPPYGPPGDPPAGPPITPPGHAKP